MRVGIDIRSLIFGKGGINRYTRNIIEVLAKFGKENSYTLFCNAKSRYKWAGHNNIKEEVIRMPQLGAFMEKLWEEILLPRRVAAKKIDLFHSPRLMLPEKKTCKFIATIHDLAFIKFPGLIEKKMSRILARQLEFSVNQADKIIAVSHNTKNDLIDLFDVAEDKIEVIYYGVNAEYRPISQQAPLREIRNKYGLPEKFILFVGTIEPRKNLKRLLEAFCALKRKKSVEHRLVIVGGKGWRNEDVFRTVEKLKLKQDVIFTGHIPHFELPLLYNNADLFVHPSLYEGFGFPPLDAMTCGIPVITSNTSSMPEVAGDAAWLVDPYNVRDIAEAMAQVLQDSSLREDMIRKGFERTKLFSWQDTAKKTLKVYTELC